MSLQRVGRLDSNRLYSIEKVMDLLDCSRASVTRLVKKGRLRMLNIEDVGKRFLKRDVEDFIADAASNARKNAPGK
jgi:biotin operon repressor